MIGERVSDHSQGELILDHVCREWFARRRVLPRHEVISHTRQDPSRSLEQAVRQQIIVFFTKIQIEDVENSTDRLEKPV